MFRIDSDLIALFAFPSSFLVRDKMSHGHWYAIGATHGIRLKPGEEDDRAREVVGARDSREKNQERHWYRLANR